MNENKTVVQYGENRKFRVSTLSAVGDRENQQDSVGYFLKDEEGLVVVADGMGGYGGGDIASKATVENFTGAYEHTQTISDYVEFLNEATVKSNDIVSGLTDPSGKRINAGTTVVATIVCGNKMYWSSVGDSRIYLYRKDEFVQMTTDLNYTAVLDEKLSMGVIDKAEYDRENKHGEALISYLGIGEKPLIDHNYMPLELQSGDKIVMMSDGLYKVLSNDEIKIIIKNFTNIVDALNSLETKTQRNSTHRKIRRDNMTVSIIEII